jgi:hypothetical protein
MSATSRAPDYVICEGRNDLASRHRRSAGEHYVLVGPDGNVVGRMQSASVIRRFTALHKGQHLCAWRGWVRAVTSHLRLGPGREYGAPSELTALPEVQFHTVTQRARHSTACCPTDAPGSLFRTGASNRLFVCEREPFPHFCCLVDRERTAALLDAT